MNEYSYYMTYMSICWHWHYSAFDTVPLLQHAGELIWLGRKRLRSFDTAIEKELQRSVRCVKNCLNYVHTAACWRAACFDLCFQCVETSSFSLQPTHLSVSTACLVSSEHTKKCFKNAFVTCWVEPLTRLKTKTFSLNLHRELCKISSHWLGLWFLSFLDLLEVCHEKTLY